MGEGFFLLAEVALSVDGRSVIVLLDGALVCLRCAN